LLDGWVDGVPVEEPKPPPEEDEREIRLIMALQGFRTREEAISYLKQPRASIQPRPWFEHPAIAGQWPRK